ncbi:MAG: hypothetical protein U5P41_02085 [Gammaproteobacteria bacterium]|nr:hypothetical protein [Gammaproteobacteria bacterium]
MIRFANSRSEVRLDPDNFIPWLVDTGPRAIQEVSFADGAALTYDQLIARGFDHIGTADDDFLQRHQHDGPHVRRCG